MVPQESAILPGYNAIGIRADHRAMVRFESEDDPGFLLIAGELLRWVGQLKEVEKNETRRQESLQDSSTPPSSTESSANGGWNSLTLSRGQYHGLSSGEPSREEVEGQITAILRGHPSINELYVPNSDGHLAEHAIEPLRIAHRRSRTPIFSMAEQAISIPDANDDTEQYDQAGREAHAAGRWELAARRFKESIDGKERQLPQDVKAAESRIMYAETLLKTNMYQLAEQQSHKVLMWAQKNPGNQDLVNRAGQVLAYALEKCNLLEEAREQFEKAAIGFETASGGADTIESLSCRCRHGMLASDHEAYDMSWPYWGAAETSLQRAAEGMSRLLGPHHNDTLIAKRGYARVLLKACRDREAYTKLDEVLTVARSNGVSDDHPMVKEIMDDLNECKTALKRSRTWTPAERLQDARKKKQKSRERQLQRAKTGHWR